MPGSKVGFCMAQWAHVSAETTVSYPNNSCNDSVNSTVFIKPNDVINNVGAFAKYPHEIRSEQVRKSPPYDADNEESPKLSDDVFQESEYLTESVEVDNDEDMLIDPYKYFTSEEVDQILESLEQDNMKEDVKPSNSGSILEQLLRSDNAPVQSLPVANTDDTNCVYVETDPLFADMSMPHDNSMDEDPNFLNLIDPNYEIQCISSEEVEQILESLDMNQEVIDSYQYFTIEEVDQILESLEEQDNMKEDVKPSNSGSILEQLLRSDNAPVQSLPVANTDDTNCVYVETDPLFADMSMPHDNSMDEDPYLLNLVDPNYEIQCISSEEVEQILESLDRNQEDRSICEADEEVSRMLESFAKHYMKQEVADKSSKLFDLKSFNKDAMEIIAKDGDYMERLVADVLLESDTDRAQDSKQY